MIKKLALFSSVLALSVGQAYAEEAPAQPADADGGSQADIVVTARKTRERIGDVPLAITAIGGDDLRRNDHIRLEDLNQLVPSTNVVVTNGHQTSISIRGIGNNPGSDGLENSAGVFVDGVYLGRPGMAASDLIDIAQIEVLRGPQGTLFGKNTTAGAVNITTELPQFDWSGRAAVTYGRFNYQQYQGTLTGPITDNLAFRLTGYDTTRDGIVKDIANGKKVSDLGRRGARLQLLYKPSNDLSVRLIGEYAREQQSSGAVTVIPSWGLTPAAIQTKLDATGAILAVDPDGLTTAAGGPYSTGTRQGAGSAEVNWTFGDGFTLTSLTAYRYWQYDSASDTEGSSADALYGGYHIKDRQFTQEVRLALPRMGNFDAVGGLYYFHQKVDTTQYVSYGDQAAAWLAGMPTATLKAYAPYSPALATLLAYNGTRWDTKAAPETNSIAAFGQVNWHVTPQWNVTGGLRVTYETKEEDVTRPVPVSNATGDPVAALASQAAGPIHARISNTAPSFLISTDYRFNPQVMAYALISRGQKAGGLNTTLPPAGLDAEALKVLPETATNYEVGIKGDFLSHALTLNLSVFNTDIRNYQANVLMEVNNQVVQLLTNAGSARTRGVEFEGTVRPVNGLSIHGFVAYNDAKYREYSAGPCPIEVTGQATCDLSGRPIAGAPKWTTGINGDYQHELTSGLVGYASAEYSFRSKYYGSLDDSELTKTGGYGLLNLRVGLKLDDRWDLSVWGRNVTDKKYASNYFNYGSVLPGTYVAFFGDPATYGATLRFSF
ncbi:iron complex outermembrane receptor protein [Novosphingobium sp. PhB165]|uniref:TonB-dependent receptor n=1 Tax=Novosphingobium sp. PhB165 TaxID=2485105 RepID=UPI001045E3F4|nr:TonB-dependent receptor [Novosphingobium sp. PhB165]TCM16562.1 iron complex outermembrane receptor protein [Novosphingobium sp. PhB165]